MKGYRTYVASGGIAILAILHAIITDPVVLKWLMSGETLLIAAAFTYLRAALGSQWSGLLDLVRELLTKALANNSTPQPPAPSGPDFNPFPSVTTDDVIVGGHLREQFPLNPQSGNPLLPLLAFGLLSASAVAAPPKAVINGPTTGTAGELLTLDASQSEGENLKFLWRVQPDVSGRRMFRSCGTTGEVIHISTMPGTWQYTLVVSNGDGADLLTWTVTIPGSPAPQPNPNPPLPHPEPGPTPGPPGPSPRPQPDPPAPVPSPSRFGLREQIPVWAASVTSPNRVANATKLADAADALAAAIAAGTTKGPTAILAALAAANTAALGSDLAAWKSFGASYSAALTGLYAMRRLNTDADWAEMLRETAAGLRLVK